MQPGRPHHNHADANGTDCAADSPLWGRFSTGQNPQTAWEGHPTTCPVADAATVLKVMIASPGDVPAERQAIRDVIHEWNAVHSEDRGVVLLPVAWESHAAPEMGDRAQGIINRQLLASADLLIAAFWTKLGSPTGIASSGTVEEIEQHLTAGKPAMLYFSEMPVALQTVNLDQYQALRDFRDSCKSRGLIEAYDNLEEFRTKLARQLATTIIDKFEGIPDIPDQRPIKDLSAEARQLLIEAMADSNGRITLLQTRAGLTVVTNNKSILYKGKGRAAAIWEGAIEELLDRDFITTKGHQGEVFAITRAGFEEGERLKAIMEGDEDPAPEKDE